MEYINDIYDARIFFKKTQAEGKKRVCALTRVSTQHEQQTNALLNQNQWIVDEINRHSDWLFDINKDLYVDEGISGTSTKNRVGFNEMIDRAKSGEYDLIVTREVCRFMRNAKLTLNLVDELEKCGVEVFFVNDGIWSFNKDDYFKLTIMATYAEQESRKVSERVFSGQATARANGVHFGNGNILGYDLVKGEHSYETTYTINKEQAETVKVIYKLVVEGFGVKKIKNYLEKNGYKTSEGGTKWHPSTIERILRRRTYMGEYEYLQSVTIDPLSHERVNQNDKSRRVKRKGKFPAIIEPELWFKVQEIIDSRINHNLNNTGKKGFNGIVVSKDMYCKKMRCGCGRRFKKDIGRVDGTGTYKCYQVIDDGSQKARAERSTILNDNCSVNGIIDWKLNLFTLKVFEYLSCKSDDIKETILDVIDKTYTVGTSSGGSNEDKLRLEKELKKLNEKEERLLDALTDGLITKEIYKSKSEQIKENILKVQTKISELNKTAVAIESKEKVLTQVKYFVENSLRFPKLTSGEYIVPEKLIEVYVNSIKACANNVFEYNIKVNSNANFDSPLVVPDDKYIPSVHSATKILDNSKATLIGEFEIDYNTAKTYANSLNRKVVRVHWQVPAKIRIFANI